MASHDKTRSDPESSFSFAVGELRQAGGELERRVVSAPLKVLHEDQGCNPYDTSGSFDRKDRWRRIGKR